MLSRPSSRDSGGFTCKREKNPGGDNDRTHDNNLKGVLSGKNLSLIPPVQPTPSKNFSRHE